MMPEEERNDDEEQQHLVDDGDAGTTGQATTHPMTAEATQDEELDGPQTQMEPLLEPSRKTRH